MSASPKKRKRSRFWHAIQVLAVIGLISGIFGVSGLLFWAATIQIPDFNLLETRKVSQSTKIYDRTGSILLYDVHKDVRRTVVGFDAVSTNIKNATVAIEDQEFYQHRGIKPTAILRAVWVNLRSGEYSQGGSTITQQVIKNALLSQEKTITRKIKEWILALKIERIMDKETILTTYLNEAPYGGNIYGIEEASMSFFGKHASAVTLAESAYLAALPQAPTLYSPYGNHLDRLVSRKNLVLKKMRELGMITADEHDSALKEEVKFTPQQEGGIRAPHFVMYIKQVLAEEYGEEALNEGGLRVTTTLDMDLQQKGEELVKKYAKDNEKNYNAKNASLVALDPRNGEILTMVGSRDYFDIKNDGNYNIALAKRQPGSAFKPFVYAAAFEKGYTPDTMLFNVRTQFSTRCDAQGTPLGKNDPSVCYMPENYDHQYTGPISLRNALAQSVNVPAVKLLYLVGLDSAIDIAERMGITTLVEKARYGLTLVLGGGEVSLLDMTSAYGVFAADGKRVTYTGIKHIEDAQGTVLYDYAPHETQVINPEIARKISDVLSDNVARTPAFGADSFLKVGNRPVAVKTGTTNNYRDAWIIGYTPSIVVGAWAGNNDNTSMEKKVAGFIIAPLWNAFFNVASSSIPNESFIPPQATPDTLKPALRGLWYGGEIYKVDKISGKLATEFTPEDLIEERVVPNPHEILYWVDKSDPAGPVPANPYSDPQFLLWEIPVQQWIAQNGLPRAAWSAVPQDFDDLHKPDLAPQVLIQDPNASTTYFRDQKIVVRPIITSKFAITRVDFFVNDMFVGSSNSIPYEFSFLPLNLSNISDVNELRVSVYDAVGNQNTSMVNFVLYPSLSAPLSPSL